MVKTPIKIQLVKTLANVKPSRIIAVKNDGDTTFSLYITDKQGVPFPIKDNSGTITITNTDGNLDINGTEVNISPTLLLTINSALQSGDNISELVNDVGYITSFTETDPIFQASEASLFVAGDKANLNNQSGVNSGDETTSSIQTKRPLKTVNGESLEGSGNVQIDYNDLANLPTPLTNEDWTIIIDENNVIWSNISDHTEEFTANGTDRNFVSNIDFASIGAVYINGVKIKRDDYLVISESEIEIKEIVTLLENDFVEIFGSVFVIEPTI